MNYGDIGYFIVFIQFNEVYILCGMAYYFDIVNGYMNYDVIMSGDYQVIIFVYCFDGEYFICFICDLYIFDFFIIVVG